MAYLYPKSIEGFAEFIRRDEICLSGITEALKSVV